MYLIDYYLKRFSPRLNMVELTQFTYKMVDRVSLIKLINACNAKLHLMMSLSLLAGFFVFFVITCGITLYVIKSSLGVDVISGWSSGFWHFLTL